MTINEALSPNIHSLRLLPCLVCLESPVWTLSCRPPAQNDPIAGSCSTNRRSGIAAAVFKPASESQMQINPVRQAGATDGEQG